MAHKGFLVGVWRETLQHFAGTEVKPSAVYGIDGLESLQTKPGPTMVIVEDCDTLDMMVDFVGEGLNPLVLNMCSDRKPGGGVRTGARAQEECIFRRTNAFLTYEDEWYPLGSKNLIYSPEITMYRDSDYKVLRQKDYRTFAMIGVSAVRNPRLIGDRYSPRDKDMMDNKIDSIFSVAVKHGHDSLVLGAIGCGAFNNPPGEVANIFKDKIGKYAGYFKKIGFAVLVAKKDDQENLTLFQQILL